MQQITLPDRQDIHWTKARTSKPRYRLSLWPTRAQIREESNLIELFSYYLPSKTSVILQICENGAPYTGRTNELITWLITCMILGLTELHACTTSMRCGLKDSTYCSSSRGSLASMETRAILRAESCTHTHKKQIVPHITHIQWRNGKRSQLLAEYRSTD